MTSARPIDDPLELLRHLRQGDRLHHCLGLGWRLLRAGRAVCPSAVQVLQTGGPWIEDGALYDFGGLLAPLADGLPTIGQAQTWAWAERQSHAAN